MPSSLKHFKTRPKFIPESQWDGAGYYYKRKKRHWTKWSESRDKKRGSTKTVGTGKYKHTHDKKR